ncbi:MAG TPA: hypothetical protein VNK91_09600 [Burkholderiaceae bacterium]|jgi:NTE family protein|nr:hypothetical protein [Burkholderiaceae bacterium]
MLQETALRWPSSEEFLSSVTLALRAKLCNRSMQWGAVRQLLLPWNWRFVLSCANLLALALRREWGVSEKLGSLPDGPEWSINGTTAENGKRFWFKRDKIGDYDLGYADAESFPLSSEMAVSAAFPGGFGPLTLDAARFEWRKRPWGAPADAERVVDIGYRHLHLYDGGVYDNLGLEPFFDAGRGAPKNAGEIIVVSDASAPLKPGFSLFALNPWRLKRVADIMSEQARALRVRAFSNYLQLQPGRGAYLYIDTPVTGSAPCSSQAFARSFPTTLRRLTLQEFDALFEHGYRVALQVEARFGIVDAPDRGGLTE